MLEYTLGFVVFVLYIYWWHVLITGLIRIRKEEQAYQQWLANRIKRKR